MMAEKLAERQAVYERELGQISYERLTLARNIEAGQKRLAEIDKRAQALEEALRENRYAQNDLKTQTAINGAKEGDTHA